MLTVNATAEGMTFLEEFFAGDPLTNDFDALELGQGNNTLLAILDRGDLTAKMSPPGVILVDTGYPKIGDTDPRNLGRADDRLTWRFTLSGGSYGALVASNAILTNYASGAPSATEPIALGVSGVTYLGPHETILLFFNATEGGVVTSSTVRQENSREVAVAATFTQRATHTATYPQGTSASPHALQVEVVEGVPVLYMARILGETGALIEPEDVVSAIGTVYVLNTANGRWVPATGLTSLNVLDNFSAGEVTADLRWPHRRGFNFASWIDTDLLRGGTRAIVEWEIRSRLGALDVPALEISLLPRAGRYGPG